MLADLLVEVQVLLRLHGCEGRHVDGFDAVEPFDAAGADVAHDYDAERVAVDFGEGLAVHFPGEHDFVGADF